MLCQNSFIRTGPDKKLLQWNHSNLKDGARQWTSTGVNSELEGPASKPRASNRSLERLEFESKQQKENDLIKKLCNGLSRLAKDQIISDLGRGDLGSIPIERTDEDWAQF